jgi:hypothetical protein
MQAPLASNAGPPSATARPRRNRSVADAIPLLVVLPSRSDTEGGVRAQPCRAVLGGSSHRRARRAARRVPASAVPPAAAPRGGCFRRLRSAPAPDTRSLPAPSGPTLRARQRLARSWPRRSPAHATPSAGGRSLVFPWGCADGRHAHRSLVPFGAPSAGASARHNGTASSDRCAAADPPRSTRLRLSRAGRRGAQGLHSSPIRSPQGDTRSGYNRLVMRSAWEVARVPAPPSRRSRWKPSRKTRTKGGWRGGWRRSRRASPRSPAILPL